MRELERHPQPTSTPLIRAPKRIAIVGGGRAGAALAAAFGAAGIAVTGPLGRGAAARGAGAVLLCVPDMEISSAAAAVEVGPPVGHCSGATGLEVLAPHAAFSVHPLMTFAGADAPSRLAGAGAAIAGGTPQTLALARALAITLGLQPVEIAAEDRGAYHAAASIASNFLVTLEAAAERLGATAGLERRLLVPLVRATVENWGQLGPGRALTGPVARGDEETIERQRSAVAERAPELIGLFDSLVATTRVLAHPPTVKA